MAVLEPSVAYRLRVALGRIARHFRSAESTGLTWSQGAVLNRLEEGGDMTAAALAAAEGIRPQSMGGSLDALEDEGLVARRPDPNDRRQYFVSLTDKGRSVIKKARASKEQWLAQAISTRLTREEAETLRNAVALLERLTDDGD